MCETKNYEELPALLTLEEVAELFRVARSTVQQWKKSGKLPCVQYGRTVRVPKHRLLDPEGEEEYPQGRSLEDMYVPDYLGGETVEGQP